MRTCTKCKVEKPFSEFNKSKKGKYGLHSQCKACLKAYRESVKERKVEYLRRYREANRELLREKSKRYIQANKQRLNERKNKWFKENSEDPQFRFKHNLSTRTDREFINKGYKRELSTEEMIGGYKKAIRHIESRFKKGMSWENYGSWVVDHLVPLSSAEDDIELIELCCYTNLQPLWRSENASKADKIVACRVEYKHEIVELV